MAAFSSRGPQTAMPDLPKPDVTAPGVQILAGAADQPAPTTLLRPGFLFQAIQGTSMASPHVAGAGALLTQAHPTLSPAELKSELMLTANPDVLQGGRQDAGRRPFDRGSGEIDPNQAADSGLVLDTTTDGLRCPTSSASTRRSSTATSRRRARAISTCASISFSKFAGKDSTTRVFKSVDSTATRWTVSFEGPARASSATASTGQFFTIKPGQTQAITVDAAEHDRGAEQVRVRRARPDQREPRAAGPDLGQADPDRGADQGHGQHRGGRRLAADLRSAPASPGSLSGVGWGLAAPTVSAGKRITRHDAATRPRAAAIRARSCTR